MVYDITDENLAKNWSLKFDEIGLLGSKPARAFLGFAVQLKFFQQYGWFPETHSDVPDNVTGYLAEQLELSTSDVDGYEWSGRSGRRHRAEILKFSGCRRMTAGDKETLRQWLCEFQCPQGIALEEMVENTLQWCLEQKIVSSSRKELIRLIRSYRQRYIDEFLETISKALSANTVEMMESSLVEPDGPTGFHSLRADTGRIALESIINAANRLAFIQNLSLPRTLISVLGTVWAEQLSRRVSCEKASEMRRHTKHIRLGMYAVFLIEREACIKDGLVDLLIDTVHKISTKAERKIGAHVLRTVEKIYGKEKLLANIAAAAIANPDGMVRKVIFPVAGRRKLQAIIEDRNAKGAWKEQVFVAMRSSYANHYRRMLPQILDVLKFRSNNAAHRPIVDALNTMSRMVEDTRRFIQADEGFPIDDVVAPKWREFVIGSDGRINRVSYEICLLSALRDRIRCKEIWIPGSNRYRNPDDDLPKDFNTNRSEYYSGLNLGLDAKDFVAKIQSELEQSLCLLNREIPSNPHVRVLWQGKNRISLSPLRPQPEPPGLIALKAEIGRRWPMTSLLDALKETALDTGFLEAFETSASRVVLSQETLNHRLLLCLYGLGTNAGLKRIAGGTSGVSYEELLHVRRRFIQGPFVREAARKTANATMAIRNPDIWGETGAGCASDSKKFGAWDRNLMTEWHARYGGRGVMIYWHVGKQSTCIYSQLKRCSSSEVASMIEGVLRHCTDMEIQRQYVDSHGQSEVAFAFCRLLGFELAPRLKALSRQKLFLPASGMRSQLPNLLPILSGVIDWDEIEQQYDEMVKYTAALRHRTADPETILRRFTRSDVMHPTYKALAELGRAIKTIFLCRYLRFEKFRQEIQEGLNVVENWNSANGFVFFGKGGEIATNRIEDQEISVQALHLLQSSLVYVNTRMMQSVLSEPRWIDRMTADDYRGMTPLIYGHFNPYGKFDLNLDKRIKYAGLAA